MLRLLGGRQLVGFSTTAALIGGLLLVVGSGSGYAASAEVRASDAPAFADPAGDQDGLAPDITGVVVSSYPTGKIVFMISVRNYNTTAPRVSFVTLVDADRNPRTGLEFGAEYTLNAGYYETGKYAAAVGRWNGANFDFSRPSSYSATFTPNGQGGVLRLEIDRKDLGNTTGFNFRVSGYWFVSNPQVYEGDNAPDYPATWTHKISESPKSAADADRDGVVNSRDRCPRARALYDTNKNGCTGPFRRMHPDLKFRALGYSSYVTIVSARLEGTPPASVVEVGCRSACSVRQRQSARAPVVVLTPLRGQRLERGSVVEIKVVKPGWIGYYARIEIRGSPLATLTTELCLPAIGKRIATPCNRVERGS